MIYKTPKELVTEIRHLMLLENISAKELARRMNTSQSNLSNILNKENPTLETLFKILNALDVELDCKFNIKSN